MWGCCTLNWALYHISYESGTCFYSRFGRLGRGYIKGDTILIDHRFKTNSKLPTPIKRIYPYYLYHIKMSQQNSMSSSHPNINIPAPTHPPVYRSNLTIPSLPYRRRTPRRSRRHPRQDCRRRDQHPRRHSRWTGQHSRRRDLRSRKHSLGCY